MSIKIVNIKSGEPYDVYCGRYNSFFELEESIFCNPFPIAKERNREQCLAEFKIYFYNRLKTDSDFKGQVLDLNGKTCACWCAPERCHLEIIKEYLDKCNQIHKIPKKYNVAIIGSRNYNNKEAIFDYLDSKRDKIDILVSGGCPKGADSIAQEWAKKRGLSILIHYPDWSTGKGAGFARNKNIVDSADIIVAWTTGSKGTQHSLDYAAKIGKQTITFNVEPDREIEIPQENKELEF